MGIVSRNMCLMHLRTLQGIVLQEQWLTWPLEPLGYPADFAVPPKPLPKFIPEYVVAQLQQQLHHLPPYLQNLVTILLETGRRIGEICAMPYDCLSKDHQNDYFLKIQDKNLRNHI